MMEEREELVWAPFATREDSSSTWTTECPKIMHDGLSGSVSEYLSSAFEYYLVVPGSGRRLARRYLLFGGGGGLRGPVQLLSLLRADICLDAELHD